MRAEDSPEQGEAGHRPLPSVNMPLLREQRRATRVRQVAVLVVLGVVGLGALVITVAPHLSPDPPREAQADTLAVAAAPGGAAGHDAGRMEADAAVDTALAARPEPIIEEPLHPGAERTAHRFGNARGFRNALKAIGLDRNDAAELEQALGGVLDFRRCHPDDRIVLERETDGHLILFEYHDSPTEFVRAKRNSHGKLTAKRVARPVERTTIARGGRIESALGDALVKANLGRSLVSTFLGVFESKVNFSTDTRSGDTFKIIVDEEAIDAKFHGYGTVHALEYQGSRTGLLRAFWHDPGHGNGDFYDREGRTTTGWLKPPCRYDRISSRFNPRRMHPLLKRVVPHTGMDYAAGRGTPVWAAAAGTVIFAGMKGANGNLVGVRHERGYETYYAHLQRIARGIKKGTHVEQRQILGAVGSTGRSTGPHLHFALKKNGAFIDPARELNGPGLRMPRGAVPAFKAKVRRLLAQLERISVPGAAAVGASAPAPGPEPEEPVDEPMD